MGINFLSTPKFLTEDELQNNIAKAMDAVMIEMVNWTRDNHVALGGWNNKTGHLEDSIDYEPAKRLKNVIRGKVKANQDYAAYVEFKEGKWVLSGTMNEFEPKLLGLIQENLNQI